MATYPVIVEFDYVDAAERTATRRYRLREAYDDVANNFTDVMTAANALETALNVLTMAEIAEQRVQVVFAGSGSANVAANNQVVAFSRTQIATGDGKGYFEVPSWDDTFYDQDSDNLLSPAYNTAAGVVAALIADIETGDDMESVEWSQSRTRKSGVRLD